MKEVSENYKRAESRNAELSVEILNLKKNIRGLEQNHTDALNRLRETYEMEKRNLTQTEEKLKQQLRAKTNELSALSSSLTQQIKTCASKAETCIANENRIKHDSEQAKKAFAELTTAHMNLKTQQQKLNVEFSQTSQSLKAEKQKLETTLKSKVDEYNRLLSELRQQLSASKQSDAFCMSSKKQLMDVKASHEEQLRKMSNSIGMLNQQILTLSTAHAEAMLKVQQGVTSVLGRVQSKITKDEYDEFRKSIGI